MSHFGQTFKNSLLVMLLFLAAVSVHAQKISLENLTGGKNESGEKQPVFNRPSPAEDKEIVAEGVGAGTTKQDALRDAMKKAVEKAVGMYMMSRSTMTDQEIKEQVIVTSDAVVTNYKEIKCVEDDGMWVVRIEAKVLPNEYLKYAPKMVSQDVSLDIANLLNTTDMMDNAKDVVDEIFKDEYYKIFRFQKTAIRMGDNVDLNSKNVSLKIDYELTFDKKEYDRFQKRLCAYLDKIAKSKDTYEYSPDYLFQDIKSGYNKPNNALWKKAGMDKSEDSNYRCIAFATVGGNKEKKVTVVSYLVRKEIFELIRFKVINDVYLVFSFLPAGGTETHKAFIDAIINFGLKISGFSNSWKYDKEAKTYDYRDTILFTDWACFGADRLRIFNISDEVCNTPGGKPKTYKKTLTLEDMPKDYVKQLKDIYIYVLNNEDDLGEDERVEKANEIESQFLKH